MGGEGGRREEDHCFTLGTTIAESGARSEHDSHRAEAAERGGATSVRRRRPALHTAENGAGAFAAVAPGLGLGGLWRPLPFSP